MNTSEILSHVDHTLLKAFATWEDIQKLCEEAMEYIPLLCVYPQVILKEFMTLMGKKLTFVQ